CSAWRTAAPTCASSVTSAQSTTVRTPAARADAAVASAASRDLRYVSASPQPRCAMACATVCPIRAPPASSATLPAMSMPPPRIGPRGPLQRAPAATSRPAARRRRLTTRWRSPTMRSDISPGGTFPDYELPDHTSTPRKLSELQGEDPLILTLARGHYCPKEHQQHLQLAAFYPQVAVAYTQMVTISTDDHHTLQEFRPSVGAQSTFLSDPERTIQGDLEIQEYTDPEHNPMIPHTLVLKPRLVIHSIYNGYWFWGRPSVEELRHDLRAVTREIRPDWDLSTPGLREAWDAGDP